MTIKLPSDVEADLVIKIAEGLQSHPIENEYLLLSDFKWAEDLTNLLPQDSKEKIERFIGERNLSKFILTEINSNRDRAQPFPKIIGGKPPTQIPFISNPIAYARSLLGTLKSLPVRYRLTAALPGYFSHKLIDHVPPSISLPSGITISKGDSIPSPLPVHSPYLAADSDLFHDWFAAEQVDRNINPNLLYFSMPLLGYATPGSSSVMGREFEDHIRAFFGAAMATQLMAYGWEGEDSRSPYIMVHNEQTREIISTEQLEDDLKERQYNCSSQRFLKNNQKNTSQKYIDIITKIGTIFNSDIDCRRLFSACIWYYRAQVNKRPLDALLQTTIAIEVMLGDRKASEGIGLTNLLSSRCAYLLGRSSAHRAEIADKFRRVYELRSQIVHEGRHALTRSDRETVQIGNSLCAAIINRELSIRAVPDELAQ